MVTIHIAFTKIKAEVHGFEKLSMTEHYAGLSYAARLLVRANISFHSTK
jgi:hypothetical protein